MSKRPEIMDAEKEFYKGVWVGIFISVFVALLMIGLSYL